MLSLKRVRQLLPDPTISDAEALEIRDQFYSLCEIIYEKWRQDRKKERAKISERDIQFKKIIQ